jgi:hypothetical protein
MKIANTEELFNNIRKLIPDIPEYCTQLTITFDFVKGVEVFCTFMPRAVEASDEAD